MNPAWRFVSVADATGWNYAMNVRVVLKVLSPSVQDAGDPDLRSQMFRIRRDRQKRLSRRFEQNAIDFSLVLIGDVCKLGWDRKNNVEIGNREQLCFSGLQPSLGG